jgi:hypothetical protein
MKLTGFLIILLLITPTVGLVTIKTKYNELQDIELSYEPLKIIDTKNYATVHLDNLKYMYSDGYPILPYFTKTYTFPLGTQIKNIHVAAKESETIFLNKKICPAPTASSSGLSNSMVTVSEGDVYSKDEFYPNDWYNYHIGVGIHNGQRVVYASFHIYPILYNPVKNELRFSKDIDLYFNYNIPAEPVVIHDEYDLIIITPDQFFEALEPLKQHKNNYGINTIIVRLDEIYDGTYFSVNGRDDAEKIKYFIKESIETWGIDYVLLVGGRNGGLFNEKWWVPVRYSHLDDGGEASFLTDLYFSDIYKYENGQVVFDDWDSDNNGVFAEWSGFKRDKLDLIPDIYIGRLPCRNVNEVDIVVKKIIDYETADTQGWFEKMVVVGGDSYPDDPDDPYFEGEEENKLAITYMEDFEITKLWASLGTLNEPEDVIAAINQGCGFLFFDGHGNPMAWSTHPPHDGDTWIDGLGVRDMAELENDIMYPVCVVGACHNSQFNVSVLNALKIWEGSRWLHYIYYGETAYECWSWRLAVKAGGGSIATLGYTGFDYFGVGDYNDDGIPDCVQRLSGFMNVNFFKEYGVNGTDILGVLHANTLITYINELDPYGYNYDAKTVEEFALMGDPTLKIGGYVFT